LILNFILFSFFFLIVTCYLFFFLFLSSCVLLSFLYSVHCVFSFSLKRFYLPVKLITTTKYQKFSVTITFCRLPMIKKTRNTMESLIDASDIQSDLLRLHEWSITNMLPFNISKCHVMRFSREMKQRKSRLHLLHKRYTAG
jgi:hypothetical protein